MTGAAATALTLLAARDPAALPLARLASLAARIEPEILRALRLALVPDATAGTEAALWFSGAVHARGPRAITLDPEVALRLRADVLADPRDRIARAIRIVHRLHRHAPALVRLEERLIVWALRGRTALIDAALAPVVSALVTDPARAEDLAAWAQRALPRLPPAARDAGAYWALLFVANLRLPATAFDAPPTAAAVAAAVPAIFATVDDLHVAVERRGDAVRLRLAAAAGPGTFPAPAVRPVVVVVLTSSGHAPIARIAEVDRWCDDVAVGGPTFTLRVADGREHVVTTIAGPGVVLPSVAPPRPKLDELLANVAAPIGRSIYAPSASQQIARDAGRTDVRVTHIIGGTGHQRSKLVRDVVAALTDDILYARTFAWGDALPDEVDALADQPGFIVLDRFDALDGAEQTHLKVLMMRSSSLRGARWIITGAAPLDELGSGPIARVLTDRLPRDPALREPLRTFATLPDTLGAWGSDAIVELLTTALELVIAQGGSERLDATLGIALDAARAWLVCPCEHHARIEVPTTIPLVESLIRAVRAAQDGDDSLLTLNVSLGLGAALTSGFEPEVLHLRLPMFGGDEVRRAEAAQAGLVNAVIELDGERPFTPRVDRFFETMRRLANDPALELFLADRDVEAGVSPRILVETNRRGYGRLLAARRQGLLQQMAGRTVRWIAEPNPPPDLEDPNRGRFGGLPDAGPLSVRAEIREAADRAYEVEIQIELVSQPADVVEILDDRGVVATLQTTPGGTHSVIRKAWRSFTVGVRSGGDRAELDLRAVPGAPDDFVAPPHAWSAIPLDPGTTWHYEGTSFNTQVMQAATAQSRMTVVEAHTIDAARPVVIALIDGSYLPSSGRWILVRYGSRYYRLAGDADDFDRLRAAPDTVESSIGQHPDLLFRFPIAKGEPIEPGADRTTGWRCADVHRRDDGTRAYDFVRDEVGRMPTKLTVTEGVGITASGAGDETGSETQILLTRSGRDETATNARPDDGLARLFAPMGRSIFAVDADAIIVQAVQSPDLRVVQLVGGTGHQRSGLVRRLAADFVDDLRFARTFEWGDRLPDELLTLADQAGFLVIDRADALEGRALRQLPALIARSITQPGAQWIVTTAEPIAGLAGSAARTIRVERLPRDRELQRALPQYIRASAPIATRALVEWGIDTLVAVVAEVSMPLNALEPLVTWLRCPCPYHAAARDARGRERMTRRLVELAQTEAVEELVRHVDETLAGFRPDDNTAATMMRAILGDADQS